MKFDFEKRYYTRSIHLSDDPERFLDGREYYVFDPPVKKEPGVQYAFDDGILYIVTLNGELIQIAEARRR